MEDLKNAAEAESQDSSRKLCMEVIEGIWAKQTGGTEDQFERAIRKQLNAPDVSREDLNVRFEDAVKAKDMQVKGAAAGAQAWADAVEYWHCK